MPLRPGDNGADVVTLRQRLAAEGFAIDAGQSRIRLIARRRG